MRRPYSELGTRNSERAVTDDGFVHFSIVLHNHQPVGNFDRVFEEAYQRAYLPFLEVYADFHHLPIGLHVSGSLWEWLEDRHPEYLDRLRPLVAAGTVELIGGGCYEPIMPMLPARDRRGQIELMRAWLRERFAVDPPGYWLTERVWEQGIVADLVRAGAVYTMADDTHFKAAGLREQDLDGYFLTEDQGRTLAVFPIPEALRYAIPFKGPEATLRYLHEHRSPDGRHCLLYADDGEKFGLWPETHKHLYTDGWLRRFFQALTEHRDWVRVVTPRAALARCPPAGRVYLPDASYREMTEWALPTDTLVRYEALMKELGEHRALADLKTHVRGGVWRNFLVKYPEAARLYARMMQVSALVEGCRVAGAPSAEAARRELYRGQCNCAYWHGVFGGLYLPHLRDAVYRHLGQAELLARGPLEGLVTAEEDDFDFDGRPEIALGNAALALMLAPQQGGQIYHLEVRHPVFNVLNTMTRRREAYHERILNGEEDAAAPAPAADASGSRETDADASGSHAASIHGRVAPRPAGLEALLEYDWYQRLALVDHCFDPQATMADVRENPLAEWGDFVQRPYQVEWLERTPRRAVLALAREGELINGRGGRRLRVQKTLTLDADAPCVLIDYRLENPCAEPLDLRFGVEWNLTLLSGDAVDRYYSTAERGVLGNLGTELADLESAALSLVNEWDGFAVTLALEAPASWWAFPVKTVSQSERGFETLYHQSCLVPHWRLTLAPGAAWTQRMTFSVERRTPAAEGGNEPEA